jgi:hypothetical protein
VVSGRECEREREGERERGREGERERGREGGLKKLLLEMMRYIKSPFHTS